MTTYIANGNPTIAIVLMALSTFKFSTLSVNRILISFNSEEAAKKFLEEVRDQAASGSNIEGKNVVVMPDYGIINHAAVAIYHAVNSYKEQLIAVNEFNLRANTEEEKNLVKEIEQYINKHFGSDAITVK